MEIDLKDMIQNVSKIKLPGGVVGKVCTVLIITALSMAAIAWTVKLVWVSLLALSFVFILCFIMLWRVISFAERNPQAALLEGAEFLVHEQLRLGTKVNPNLTVNPKDFIESHPVNLSEKEQKEAQEPDPPKPPPKSLSDTRDKEGRNG